MSEFKAKIRELPLSIESSLQVSINQIMARKEAMILDALRGINLEWKNLRELKEIANKRNIRIEEYLHQGVSRLVIDKNTILQEWRTQPKITEEYNKLRNVNTIKFDWSLK